MAPLIASDLHVEFGEHSLRIRGEANRLVAELQSITARMKLRRTVPVRPGPLPAIFQSIGLDLEIRVRVRGRDVGSLRARENVVSVRTSWWGLLKSVFRIPGTS